jgi:hypothetical protein
MKRVSRNTTQLIVARRFAAVAASLSFLLGAYPSFAQEDAQSHMQHMQHMPPDTRQALDFPQPMREHMLSNMRAHLEAIGEVLAALAANDPAKAGEIAETRLGMSSPGAAGCRPFTVNEGMAAMMARHMPEPMRAIGLAMHQSASKFAEEAKLAKTSGDTKPALAALAEVTQNCAACHAAYRLK